jgi:hypothetical protein
MDKNLKDKLIIIGVLLVIYLVISPYQNCMRTDASVHYCGQYTSW